MPNFNKLERDLRKLLPVEKYGLRQALLGKVYRDDRGIYLLRDRSTLNFGWECSDAAFVVSEVLKERGISNSICVGTSQDRLANVHIFVSDEDGLIYDACPLYPFIGARHKVIRKLGKEEIEKAKVNNKLYIQGNGAGQLPITWDEIDGLKHVVSVGKSTHIVKNLTQFENQIGLLVARTNGNLISCLETIALINGPKYVSRGFEPQVDYTKESSIRRLIQLQEEGIVKIVPHQFPENVRIPQQMADKLADNCDVFCSLIEKVASCINHKTANRQT